MDALLQHPLYWLLALAAVFTFVWLWLNRARLSIHFPAAILLSLLHVAVGVGCVKVFAILETLDLSNAGNMSLFGAVFFLPLFYFLGAKLFKRQAAVVFDVFTVPMVFTLLCARINCLFSGCCLGLPLFGTSLRWPTREAELVYYVLILGWLIYRTRKGEPHGLLYPFYMMTYGCFRFIIEFFRASEGTSLFHIAHLWSVLCFVIGASFYFELRHRASLKAAPKSQHRRKNK